MQSSKGMEDKCEGTSEEALALKVIYREFQNVGQAGLSFSDAS